MLVRTRDRLHAAIPALLLMLGAPAVMANGDDGHGHSHGGFDFGAAAPNAQPDRTIEVIARDTMDFEPESITVQPGEVVRFKVRNVGNIQHSFTLGSPEYQKHHEEEMKGMAPDKLAGHMEDEPNGLVVQSGEAATLTWRFEGGGPVQFACHIPGHYPAGMQGRIRIRGSKQASAAGSHTDG